MDLLFEVHIFGIDHFHIKLLDEANSLLSNVDFLTASPCLQQHGRHVYHSLLNEYLRVLVRCLTVLLEQLEGRKLLLHAIPPQYKQFIVRCIILMSTQKLGVQEVVQKRGLVEEQVPSTQTEGKAAQGKRKNVIKVINSNVPPGLFTSYSTKFIVKRHQKSKSPATEPKRQKTKPALDDPRQKRKSLVCNPGEQNDSARNTRYFSTRKNSMRTVSLSTQIQDEINKIKSLSKLMLDLKFPSALPSKTRKLRKLQGAEDKNPEQKPLISVKIQRENGFIRPVMYVREQQKQLNEHKQLTEKKLRGLFKSKQKMKTAPASVEFVLHIKSHHEVFQQENRVNQAKNKAAVKRFRSTWTKKPSKPRKVSEAQVSPWLVTQPMLFE